MKLHHKVFSSLFSNIAIIILIAFIVPSAFAQTTNTPNNDLTSVSSDSSSSTPDEGVPSDSDFDYPGDVEGGSTDTSSNTPQASNTTPDTTSNAASQPEPFVEGPEFDIPSTNTSTATPETTPNDTTSIDETIPTTNPNDYSTTRTNTNSLSNLLPIILMVLVLLGGGGMLLYIRIKEKKSLPQEKEISAEEIKE